MLIDRSRFLTIEESAEKSGYSSFHIYRLVASGEVASMDIGKVTHLVDYTDLLRYMQEKPQRKPHRDKKQNK